MQNSQVKYIGYRPFVLIAITVRNFTFQTYHNVSTAKVREKPLANVRKERKWGVSNISRTLEERESGPQLAISISWAGLFKARLS